MNELSNTSIAAMENVVNVLDDWFGEVGAEVSKNLDAARSTGLTAGVMSAWGVRAVELMVKGATGVATAMLDGAALFSQPSSGVRGEPEVETAIVDSTSDTPVKLRLVLTGIRTSKDIDAGRVVIDPPTVEQGETEIQVSVDLSGLDPDVYVGTFECEGSATVIPSTISFTLNP